MPAKPEGFPRAQDPISLVKNRAPAVTGGAFSFIQSGRQRNRPALMAGQSNELMRGVAREPRRVARWATHELRGLPVDDRVGHEVGGRYAVAVGQAHSLASLSWYMRTILSAV